MPEIAPIDASDTLDLRHEILRPASAGDDLVFAGDDAHTTAHFGWHLDGHLRGIATVMLDDAAPLPASVLERGVPRFRLRGMAVVEEFRTSGVGRALVRACEGHAITAGGVVMWCNARTPALGFYERLGYQTHGDEFAIPGAGNHFVMWRLLAE